jgi:hypothetical protein
LEEGGDDVPFAALRSILPDLAAKETRSIHVLDIPRWYHFDEMFCDEPGCDCRRAWIMVYSDEPGVAQPRASISWGWEPEAFYRRWAKFPLEDDDLVELKGPGLVRFAHQSEEAAQLLASFRGMLSDPVYAARIVAHYVAFRAVIDAPRARVVAARVGRNEACPCGSGRKYKRCCLGAADKPR